MRALAVDLTHPVHRIGVRKALFHAIVIGVGFVDSHILE